MQDELENRRRRLLYRSSYTGMKETDILLGAFARAHLASLSPAQLDQYEAILDTQEDPRIYAWITGAEAVPAAFDTEVMRLLKQFNIAT